MSTALAERSWCVVVPHHARGARMARHRLAAELADLIRPALLADVVAVVAELVGNAVRHAAPLPGGVIRVAWLLRSETGAEVVEIRVTDGGAAAPPQIRVVGPEAVDGRGLYIVAALATRWGVERDGLGQSVWAQVSSPGAAQVSSPGAESSSAGADQSSPGADRPSPGVDPAATSTINGFVTAL